MLWWKKSTCKRILLSTDTHDTVRVHWNRQSAQFLPPTTTGASHDASQERTSSPEGESSHSSDSSTEISSDSESSDSDSESSSKASSPTPDLEAVVAQIFEGDSDDDSTSNHKTRKVGQIPATVHEILAPQVAMPSITSVEPSETIELIGEVLSIVDSVVVVKSYEHGHHKVLDTDSLFVFEDRKVLGLVRPAHRLLFKDSGLTRMCSCFRSSKLLAP
jgi:hypothetical protein